ncbi:Succinyl-diaminopimelate desuccinylase [Hartmannibacter diazotrophicus]|uniref:Succinyl-diaminopimelate desuccinylase n=1 Tax=Hartmannibacter diazotrophicus TaxID=1482074 RepID=A0A2C9D3N9_9HYPH|nr:dipeptidase [Hartmannibacter diazotrophicus]SON54843.1 Succinyl-diaminopimelate desuccinylase [Hartmannibacter diazotrophicus]
MSSLTSVLARLDADFDKSLERLFDLLRLKSISTDTAFKPDCRKAAEWLVADLSSIGFEASLRETPGHPMVVAHYRKAHDAPHVLFYGHYDVQPVDPLELWKTPPFEPRVEEAADGSKRIVARGAADDKGQLLTFVEAARAFLAETGSLPLNVTILLEGEEESGSPSLVPFLEATKKELSADVALICDTSMWNATTPAITTMLRGLVGEEIVITCADRDLHSGLYGGASWNPIRVLTSILGDLHDETGRVVLPGFYDGVSDISPDVKANWDRLDFDETAFLGGVGLKTPAGEAGRTVLEQLWARPTAEINGISGGYTGEGFKTVLPSKASAKVSFRLVVGQNPDRIRASFRKFVEDRLPPDARVEFHAHGGGPGLKISDENPALKKALGALTDEWTQEAAVIGGGGSIPIVGLFKDILGMDSLLIGFGLDDDRIHSPNEKYEMESFRRGQRSWARIIAALADKA